MDAVTVDGYEVSRATEEDVSGFLELHQTVFGTWPKHSAREVFRWKYEDTPYFEDLPVIVARKDGEVVGAKGHFGYEMVVGGETLIGNQTVDLMVHPEHRRQGIHAEMVAFDKGLFDPSEQLYFGFPGDAAAKAYDSPHRRPVENPFYVRPMSPSFSSGDGRPRVRRAVQTFGFWALKVYHTSLDLLWSSPNDVDVERVSEPPVDTLESLYREHVPDGIHARRTATFYRWRLSDPLEDVTTYLARRDGAVIGAVVVGEREDKAFLRDVLPFSIDAGPLRALLRAVIEDSAEKRYVGSWLPACMSASELWKAGFVTSNVLPRSSYSTDVLVRSLGRDWIVSGVELDRAADWDVQLLERDF